MIHGVEYFETKFEAELFGTLQVHTGHIVETRAPNKDCEEWRVFYLKRSTHEP